MTRNEQVRIAEQTSCPICFGDFGPPEELGIRTPDTLLQCVTTECKHAYCGECILNVCAMEEPEYSGRCAVCRGGISLKTVFFLAHAKDDPRDLKVVKLFPDL